VGVDVYDQMKRLHSLKAGSGQWPVQAFYIIDVFFQQFGHLQTYLAEQHKPQRIHTKDAEGLMRNMPI